MKEDGRCGQIIINFNLSADTPFFVDAILENSYTINKNVEKNTQVAEFDICDTDMTKEIMAMSLQNILGWVGEVMIAQANHNRTCVWRLLR